MEQTIRFVVPPVTTALTTVEAVQAELADVDDTSVWRLPALIEQASSLIVDYIGRSLARATVAESFDPIFLDWSWRSMPHRRLRLSYLPIVSVTSATYRDAIIDVTLMRYAAETGLLYGANWYSEIVYVGGYALPGQPGRDLPPSIERACIDTVVALWFRASRGNPMIRSESVEGIGSTSYLDPSPGAGAAALPPTALASLASYREVLI